MIARTTLTTVFCLACSAGADAAATGEARVEVLASAATPAVAADRKGVDALVGVYRHGGGQAEQDALESAVDGVVSEMNILVREIARKRLLASNNIPTALTVVKDGATVTISFDERVYTAMIDGPAVNVIGSTGDPLKMTLRVRGGKLVQHFVGDKGARTNTMRRSDDGLHLAVVVESESLPRALSYELTFARR